MKELFISVIIPVYNVKEYLEQCVDSVLAQSYKEIEIILINDGSTDGSGEICDNYRTKDNRVIVIHKENGGLSSARNYGLRIANGEYIMYLDSDDFLCDIDCIKKLKNEICIRRSEVLLYKSKKYFKNKSIDYYGDYDLNIFNSGNRVSIFEYMIKNNKQLACAWNKIVARDFLIKNNLFFVENTIGEDIEWIVKVFEKLETIGAINEIFHVYRQCRQGSITATISEKKLNNLFDIIKNISNGYKEYKNRFEKNVLSFMAFEYAILLVNASKLSDGLLIEKIKKYDWLFEYAIDKKTLIIKKIYKILGVDLTMKLLRIIKR